MGIKISKDHLHPSVIESITSLIGDLNQLETDAKGNAVEAINEILANGGNKEELEALIAEIAEGKELITSILQEEGVEVTEEDNMASLITKVDNEFNDKNNEIGDMKQGLIDTLTSKGINVDDSLSFDELLDLVNVQLPPTLVLYDNGYVNTEIVGSFTQVYDGNVGGNTTMEMNEDHINVNVNSNYTSNSPVYFWGGIYSELAIDTSNYRAVHIEYSRGNGLGGLNVGMDANKQIRVQQSTSVNYSASAPITELNTKYIATCSFTPGDFYFLAYIYGTNDSWTCNFKIHRIWLDSIID